MTGSRILETGHSYVSAIQDACADPICDTSMLEAFRDNATIRERALAADVVMVGNLIRRGVFHAHGYTRPEYAIADLLGWDLRPARRRVKLAQQICPRTTLDGQPLPALLPATATVFAEGRVTVPVAEAILEVLTGPAALRLNTQTWAGVEEQVAQYAATNRVTPNEITRWARQLVEAYDHDGADPGEEPEQTNELRMTRKPSGTGGYLRGELDGPTYEALHTAIGALCAPRPSTGLKAGIDGGDGTGVSDADGSQTGAPHPLGFRAGAATARAAATTGDGTSDDTGDGTGDDTGGGTSDDTGDGTGGGTGGYVDTRTLPQRQADALAELCGFALRHDHTLPDTGGERPQVRITLDLERLRDAVAGAHLDTGAWYSPSQLRMLACEAFVIPAVMGGNSEPLDIGRATRTIPTAIRRAVAIRDGGCSFPGCNRPPTWCDVHHCTEWADGGDTALHNCTMLCRHHHTIIHQSKWAVRIREGHPEFTPPEFVDRQQRTRRKISVIVS